MFTHIHIGSTLTLTPTNILIHKLNTQSHTDLHTLAHTPLLVPKASRQVSCPSSSQTSVGSALRRRCWEPPASPGEAAGKGDGVGCLRALCWFWKSFQKVTWKWMESHPREGGLGMMSPVCPGKGHSGLELRLRAALGEGRAGGWQQGPGAALLPLSTDLPRGLRSGGRLCGARPVGASSVLPGQVSRLQRAAPRQHPCLLAARGLPCSLQSHFCAGCSLSQLLFYPEVAAGDCSDGESLASHPDAHRSLHADLTRLTRVLVCLRALSGFLTFVLFCFVFCMCSFVKQTRATVSRSSSVSSVNSP